MPAARTAPRALLLLLLLAAASTATAKFCYVGVSDQRVYDTSTEAIECAPALYGDNAACAFACARHKKDKTDVCSFLCIPGQHCNADGRLHPVSEVSPGLFLPGCPKQENFEPVNAGDATYECVAKCCTKDRCNVNAAPRTGPRRAALLGVLAASILSAAVATTA